MELWFTSMPARQPVSLTCSQENGDTTCRGTIGQSTVQCRCSRITCFVDFVGHERTSILRTPSVIELPAVIALSSFEFPIEVYPAGAYSGEPARFLAGPLAEIDGNLSKSSSGELPWFRTFASLPRSIAISFDSFVQEGGRYHLRRRS
jgi:hypothetical protein